jgi:multiple sugar transport system ATP-binding protein
VFQNYALYPHMTVAENMSFGLRLKRYPKAEIKSRIDEAARMLDIVELVDRKPKQLSGGQRQRVAMGRAIVRNPKVFLFDEPLSNLDAALRGQMRIELSRLHEELNATMIYVTHDQIEAMTMADKIVVLQAGRVEQVGSPLDLYHHPANLFVAGFIGSPRMNMLPAKVVDADVSGTTVALSSGQRISAPVETGTARPGDIVTLGIRPEGLHIDPGGTIPARVSLVERLGGLTLLHVIAEGDQEMTVQTEGSAAVRPHEQIRLAVDPSACHLFDQTGQALPHLDQHPLAA